SGLALTGAGRQQALRFLRVDSPKGLTWKRVKQQHLLAKGLGLPASKQALTRVSDADGVRALVLKRAHRVEGPETPTLAQVRDRLLWRQLGVETEEAFSLRAVQAHLLGKLLEQEVSDPKRGVEQLAARAVGASRVDAEVVRMAALREWVLAEAPGKTLPTDTVSFARRVMDAAQAVPPSGRFGNNKVFISHVWKALQPEWADRPAFNEALLAANRARELSLGRADLLSVMDPQNVAESEVRSYGASFHFVVL
ncbi:hypothetical protein D7X55_23250, partial [Corallococcus sp. AB049A]|uniref:hypothetical protein n=1 Tax=Corallococcus sp. AB049A TaxID=2316721 RepID=UPI000EED65D1